MPTLSEIFDKRKILLYQNESLDLDHLAILWMALVVHIKLEIWF